MHCCQLFPHTDNLLLSVNGKLFLAVKLGLNRLQDFVHEFGGSRGALAVSGAAFIYRSLWWVRNQSLPV